MASISRTCGFTTGVISKLVVNLKWIKDFHKSNQGLSCYKFETSSKWQYYNRSHSGSCSLNFCYCKPSVPPDWSHQPADITVLSVPLHRNYHIIFLQQKQKIPLRSCEFCFPKFVQSLLTSFTLRSLIMLQSTVSVCWRPSKPGEGQESCCFWAFPYYCNSCIKINVH